MEEFNKIRSHILDQTRAFFNSTSGDKIVPGENYIPVSGKLINSNDVVSVVDSALDMWFTAGRYSEDLERKLAEFMHQKFCLLVNSGSSANLVAMSTLTSSTLGDRRVQPGDEVITLAAGFPTTVNPIVQVGAVPVFVDVDIESLQLDVSYLERALSEKTKAVFIAHTLGNVFELDQVRKFCEKHNLWLIEDCCDALGAKYDGKLVGTYGDICTLSFYPAHHITTGEGGAVLTSSPKLKKLAESFRDWGRDCWCPPGVDNSCKKRFNWQLGDLPRGYDHKYIYSHIGYNLKMTDMQAALGLSQLTRVEEFIEKRNQNFKLLHSYLNGLDDCLILPKIHEKAKPSWFGFPITVKDGQGFSRNDLRDYLEAKKIGTRMLFAGNLTKQPLYENVKYRIVGNLKNTDIVMNNTFWVGVFPRLNDDHMKYIADVIKEFLSKRAK